MDLDKNIKLHFAFGRSKIWPEFLHGDSALRAISDQELAQRCAGAFNNWIMQPAVLLAQKGIPFTWGRGLRPGSINIVSGIDFGIRERDVRSFVLAMRADGPYPHIANYVGQQNMLALRTGLTSFFPHLPQPGLVERSESRGVLVENVSFKGDLSNLAPPFRSDAFKEALLARELNLQIDLRSTDWNYGMKMHDYQQVDVVIAVRNLTQRDYRTKPASKLVNAWLAGVPAILGPEPAFRELRQSDLDYFEVSTPDDALLALDRLKGNPALYRAMVENGRLRAQKFTKDAVIESWIKEINGPVYSAFIAWDKQGWARKALRYPYTAFLQKASWHYASLARKNGRRGPGDLSSR